MNEKGEKRKDYFDTCNVYYIPLLSIENVIWRNVSCRTACEKGMITDGGKWKEMVRMVEKGEVWEECWKENGKRKKKSANE